MCWYCGCHTKAVRRYSPIAAYVELLKDEIDLVAGTVPGRLIATHIHFGGGTPTILSREDLLAVMASIRLNFDIGPGCEVAVESDPRILTEETASTLAGAGVTRVSLGVQEFSPTVQQAVNRIQPFSMVASGVRQLRAAGIAAINFDLMYGLPYQTVSDCIRTADLAASLDPDRLAVFGYAHVPWMKPHQRWIQPSTLPGAEERIAQSEAVATQLVAKGYRQIGLDHFAKPGDSLTEARQEGRLRRNFQGYTADAAETLLGVGASAIGRLRAGYVQNAVPVGAYAAVIRSGQFATMRGVVLNADDRVRSAIIERLMCDLSVDLKAIAARHDLARDCFADEISALRLMERDGIVDISDRRIKMTDRGRPFLRSVAAVFDSYVKRQASSHTPAV
jgi:oxygen-independent coproporphyrinogen-3 oxidase